jgi:hypothetical protein
MSFYNPYMKDPDWGAGISGLSSQIMQMLMMQKMFPEQEKSMGQTQLPQQGMMQKPDMGKLLVGAQDTMKDRPGFGPGAGGPGGLEGAGTTGLNQDILKKILAALEGLGGGVGGGMGGF